MQAHLSRDTCTSIYKVIDNFVHCTLMPAYIIHKCTTFDSQ